MIKRLKICLAIQFAVMICAGLAVASLPKITPTGSISLMAVALGITSFWLYDVVIHHPKAKVNQVDSPHLFV